MRIILFPKDIEYSAWEDSGFCTEDMIENKQKM